MGMCSYRSQPYIREITPHQLNPELALWLDNAVKADYYGAELGTVIERVLAGQYQIWAVEGDAGIIVTELVQYGTKLILCIVFMAGQNILQNLDKLELVFGTLGRLHKWDSVQFLAQRPGLKKLYRKRYTPVAEVFKWEIDHGK